MATENGTFSYKPTTSGTYTWSFRMKNSGMVAQPASVYYLDNLQVSYPYPYTRIDCDKGPNASYRFGFNGKELENEIYEEGNAISYEFITYDSRLGRMFSPDPRESNYPWQSTYSYYRNSLIATIDFLGLGDYYDKSGNHLGSDGKTVTVGKGKNKKEVADDKAYVCESVEMGKNGLVSSAKNSQLLSVSNSVLNQYANTVAEESSGNKEESYAIASTISNLSKLTGKSISNTLQTEGIYGYGNGGNSTTYNNNAEYGMGAAINALTGGHDYSNGAIRWDVSDFFRKWTSHDKPTNQGVNISLSHLKVMQKTSPNSKVTAGLHLATSGLLKNTCWYNSTAAHGGTIFWGKYLKTETTFRPFGSYEVNENGQAFQWQVPAYKVKGFIPDW